MPGRMTAQAGSGRCGLRARMLLAALPALWAAQAMAQETSAFDSLRASVVKIRTHELIMRGGEQGFEARVAGQGSGVVIGADGKVLTAAHLVQSADEIEVEFAGGRRARARVFASEPAADVALLELVEAAAPPGRVGLGDSRDVDIGDGVMVLGFPSDFDATATFGRVSGRLGPATPYGRFEPLEFIVVDAHVLPGASGGPVFDAEGRVIGVATGMTARPGDAHSLGFAVASSTARALLLERRSLWTGISGRMIRGDLASALNLPQSAGLLVERIAAYSPASALGLQAGSAAGRIEDQEFVAGGDVILSMLGISLADPDGYQRASAALAALKDGDPWRVKVLRAGAVLELEGKLYRRRR